MDEIYFPPEFVGSLDDVPPEWRDDYQPYRHGSKAFRLNARMLELVTSSKQQVEQIQAETKRIIEDGERRLSETKVQAQRERAERALSTALVQAGAKKGLAAGAVAILMEQHRFEVEPSYEGADARYVVMADIAGSLASVEHVAREFLDSDEGEPFRGKPRELQSDGRFTSIIEELKRSR